MTEHGNTVRLVPRDQDPFQETMELVEEHGWEETDQDETWSVPDKDAVVRHVTDGATDVEFFEVEGSGRKRVAKQLEDKIDMLEPPDFEEFLGKFESQAGVRQGLYVVATAAPQDSDPELVELLERYLADEEPLTRRTAMVAMGITRWQDFVKAITKVRDDDPDAAVRRDAEAALRALQNSS